ncbi:MAG: OstA family protein [Proteobacteria bacterium]|nr:OstA family protein [Pseudomonadota bacterium]
MLVRLVAGMALGAGALLAAGQVGASGFAGHDANAPVDYAAERMELLDKEHRVILSGDVRITQGDLTVRAPRTVVEYANQGSLQIQRLDASGGVTVTRGDESARGDVAAYDFNARVITLAGNVVLTRAGGDNLRSGRLVIDLNSHLTTTSAGPGGRVSGSFTVPKKGK